jgi:hypothetical protein
MGLNVAGPKALGALGAATRGARGRLATKMYEAALKPSTTIDPARRAAMIGAGLSEGIPVSRTGVAKINDLISDLNEKIAATIEAKPPSKLGSVTAPARTISPEKVAGRLKDVEAKFVRQVNPQADLDTIARVRQEFMDSFGDQNLTAPEAQALKQGTYKQLKGRAYGELKRAEIEAQKALARGLKEELAEQFPELRALNAKEGALIELEKVMRRAVNRSGNWDVIGISSPLTGLAATAATGSGGAGLAAGVMREVLRQPAVSTRLAIALAKSSKTPLGQSRARIAGYLNALGQAVDDANAQNPDDQSIPQNP